MGPRGSRALADRAPEDRRAAARPVRSTANLPRVSHTPLQGFCSVPVSAGAVVAWLVAFVLATLNALIFFIIWRRVAGLRGCIGVALATLQIKHLQIYLLIVLPHPRLNLEIRHRTSPLHRPTNPSPVWSVGRTFRGMGHPPAALCVHISRLAFLNAHGAALQ